MTEQTLTDAEIETGGFTRMEAETDADGTDGDADGTDGDGTDGTDGVAGGGSDMDGTDSDADAEDAA
jgi:hypothetical protein